MSSRTRIVALLDEADAALNAGRTRIARRRLLDARALVVFRVPAAPELCPECEIGGGNHVDGCTYATGRPT
jgi:hypothetical protein